MSNVLKILALFPRHPVSGRTARATVILGRARARGRRGGRRTGSPGRTSNATSTAPCSWPRCCSSRWRSGALHVGDWRGLGLRPDRRPRLHAALGFAAASGLLWLLGLLLWALDIYEPRELPAAVGDAGRLSADGGGRRGGGEAFFAAPLLGLSDARRPPTAALVFVSALFAALHFLKPPEHAAAVDAVRWWSGFAFLPKTFWQWREPGLVLGGFTTLFAVAMVLGSAGCERADCGCQSGCTRAGYLG